MLALLAPGVGMGGGGDGGTNVCSPPCVGPGYHQRTMGLPFCRHVDYVPAGDPNIPGMPIVRVLHADTCVQSGLTSEYYGARHSGYTPEAMRIVATSLICCNVIDSRSRVQTACLPGGITRKLRGHATDVENCASAFQSPIQLNYCLNSEVTGTGTWDDDIDDCADGGALGTGVGTGTGTGTDGSAYDCDVQQGKWTGNLTLRGGILDLEMCCFLDPDSGDTIYRLQYTGCDTGYVDVLSNCTDPLILDFGNITVNNCCDCTDSIQSGTINIQVYGNCRETVMARHIDYTTDGVPVVAQQATCDYTPEPVTGCLPRCGLVMTITNVSGDCTCMEGTYTLPFTSATGVNLWQNVDVGTCTSPTDIQLHCTDNDDGTVTLQLDLSCGANTVGSSSQTIDRDEMEELDVTFLVQVYDQTLGTGSGVTCGDCTYQWNAMAASWSLITDGCTGLCTCVDALTLPPGTVDGETTTVDCESPAGSNCCLGYISIRIMR